MLPASLNFKICRNDSDLFEVVATFVPVHDSNLNVQLPHALLDAYHSVIDTIDTGKWESAHRKQKGHKQKVHRQRGRAYKVNRKYMHRK